MYFTLIDDEYLMYNIILRLMNVLGFIQIYTLVFDTVEPGDVCRIVPWREKD